MVAEALDNALPLFLKEVISHGAADFLEGACRNDRAPGIFTYKNVTYHTLIAPSVDPTDLLQLRILVREPDLPAGPTRKRTVALAGLLKYRRIRVQYPSHLPIDSEMIAGAVKVAYDTASRWLQSQVASAVGHNSVSFGALYRTLWTLTSSDDACENTWFVAVKKEHGFFIYDKPVIDAALERCVPLAARVDKSAFEMVADMMSMYLPFDMMHSSIAVGGGRCIDVDLTRESKYALSNPELLDSELAIFGGKDISIFPLAHEDLPFLAAGFPRRLRPTLELVFSIHRSRFVRQYRRFESRLKMIISRIQSQVPNLDHAATGEFLGGVLVGALKRLSP